LNRVKVTTGALATMMLAPGCSEDPRAALDGEWRQLMQCSAYFSLRAAAARESRTAAADRAAAAAQADAALASGHGYELAGLAGQTAAEADTQFRAIASDLWDTIEADLDNIGRLRARHDEPCRTMLADAGGRADYWRRELR